MAESNKWSDFFPDQYIVNETDNFIWMRIPDPQPTEGLSALLFMERMLELGYVFIDEGWNGLVWRKVK